MKCRKPELKRTWLSQPQPTLQQYQADIMRSSNRFPTTTTRRELVSVVNSSLLLIPLLCSKRYVLLILYYAYLVLLFAHEIVYLWFINLENPEFLFLSFLNQRFTVLEIPHGQTLRSSAVKQLISLPRGTSDTCLSQDRSIPQKSG